MNLTLAEAQDCIEWIRIANDESLGPPPWDFLKRLKDEFPMLEVPGWLLKPAPPEPRTPRPDGCLCDRWDWKHADTCPLYDYPA